MNSDVSPFKMYTIIWVSFKTRLEFMTVAWIGLNVSASPLAALSVYGNPVVAWHVTATGLDNRQDYCKL